MIIKSTIGEGEIEEKVHYCHKYVGFEVDDGKEVTDLEITLYFNNSSGQDTLTEIQFNDCVSSMDTIGSDVADEAQKLLDNLSKEDLQKLSTKVDNVIQKALDDEDIQVED